MIQDWTTIELPEWLSGNRPRSLLESADLQVRDGAGPGQFIVKSKEAYLKSRPALIESQVLDRPGSPSRLGRLSEFKERAEYELDFPKIQRMLDDAVERGSISSDLVHAVYHAQGVIGASPPAELLENATNVLHSLREIPFADAAAGDPRPFGQASVAVVTAARSQVLRLRLPSILLRMEADPALKAGDTRHLTVSTDEMLFPSSHGLYEGVYMLDPYVGPLLGAASPSFWCIAAARTFGIVLVPLGRAIAGTTGRPNEVLEAIHIKGPSESYPVPPHSIEGQLAAISWWASRLNEMFGVISDPSTFRASNGTYVPSAHLEAILSVEQLFRRVTSLLVQHRDVTTQQALLFTCLDTLESLTGISPLNQCTASHAANRLKALQADMPLQAQSVLLPTADRALNALLEVQEGFTLAKQQQKTRIEWSNKSATFEDAAAYHLVGLRNSTHGHGGGRADERERRTTLLIQHDGRLPDNLPKLAYLYLLELLCNPERLRKILSSRVSR